MEYKLRQDAELRQEINFQHEAELHRPEVKTIEEGWISETGALEEEEARD